MAIHSLPKLESSLANLHETEIERAVSHTLNPLYCLSSWPSRIVFKQWPRGGGVLSRVYEGLKLQSSHREFELRALFGRQRFEGVRAENQKCWAGSGGREGFRQDDVGDHAVCWRISVAHFRVEVYHRFKPKYPVENLMLLASR